MAEENATGDQITDLHAPPVPAAGNTPSDIMKIFNLSDDEAPAGPSEDGVGEASAPAEPAPVAAGGEGVPASPQTPSPSPSPAPTPSPAPAPQPAAVTEPAPAPSEIDQLRAQITQLTGVITHLQSQVTAPKTEAQPTEQPANQPSPYASVAIPAEILNGIFNEDPNVAGQSMNRLIQSVMAYTHQNVMNEVKAVLKTQLDTRFQTYETQTQEQQQQARMEQEYYSSFPNHNSPQLRQIVAQVAQTKAMQLGPTYKWGPDFINAVGAEVNAQITAIAQSMGLQPATPQPMTPQPNPQPQPAEQSNGFPTRPAVQLGATPRASEPQSAANFIKSTLE